ncbi:hypothetical protein NQ315_009473 [Exocentrus adspersus]|uniref:Phospholipid/glycerol acyltransferase domain-containing protein n=1 Tax=Exocentrus adspersus TaxID=1586481 RepID=A0AAV8WG73_9CUCU|nr:hypothetical protein NQ315_009473 [Exocentrus adspersus]
MGNCPVIFVPSHRSYADFILISYLCFTYDIEVPAIAAGMDFHGMWGMGNVLRHTGAFFMRRSYNNDALYWTTFKQYVYQLVSKGDLPVEFFVEGTRSRTNKSLTPKYGLISMVLKPFFFCEVPDIKFVPINISYDRILEEALFAFELLGVPKPKESTSAFIKSLKIVKENVGNIYFCFGRPISAKSFFGSKLDRSVHHNKGPLHTQDITIDEKSLIPSLAYDIIRTQQKCSTITIFNLVSLILNDNLVRKKTPLSVKELIDEVKWMKEVIEKLGAFVFTEDMENSVEQCFIVHKNLIELQPNGTICLVQNSVILDKFNPSQLKAHSLSEECMTFSIPFVMLQMYINPTLYYFIDAALIVTVLKYHANLNEEGLFSTYHFLRSLFSMEFVTVPLWEKTDFVKALQYSASLNLVRCTPGNLYELANNTKLQDCLYTMLEPFMTSYFVTVVVMERCSGEIDEKSILVNVQKILEDKINDGKQFIHPYCLNLDTLTNCLSVLVRLGALNKIRSQKQSNLHGCMLQCHIEDEVIVQSYTQSKL